MLSPRPTEHKRSFLPGASDPSRQSPHFSVVMAGLGPAIHLLAASGKTWMRGTSPGTSPRMTVKEIYARRDHAGTQEHLSRRPVEAHCRRARALFAGGTVLPGRLIFVSGLLARKSFRICGYAPLPYRAVSAPEGNY
jgi:hypothetical protein